MKFDLEERLIWFKGELIPIKNAKVMALSPTAQFGLNVFEGIPCYWNEEKGKIYAFRLEDHFDRLLQSAKLIRISIPYTKEEMKRALVDVVSENAFSENIIVRQTVFIDDFGSWTSEGPGEMFLVPTPRSFTSGEYNCQGLNVCISSWRRISDDVISPRIKCGANYINSRMGQKEALENGYDTCVFLNDSGKVAEGPGSCLFMVSRGVLVTPRLTESVLESITRDSIIKIAKKRGIRVEERPIDRTELYSADEVFLCGSSMEITPVFCVDAYVISNSIGDVTERIRKDYIDAVTGKNENYAEWVTEL